MTEKYVQVDRNNVDQFLRLMETRPEVVMLGVAEASVSIGEVLLPPYQPVSLALNIGVAIRGQCAVCGEVLHLAINQFGNIPMTRPTNITDPFLGWKPVERWGRKLHLFIPESAAAQVACGLREYSE